MTFEKLEELILEWAEPKGLLKRENTKSQMIKVFEETAEIGTAILKDDLEGKADGIGDAFVTLIILSSQLGLDPVECLEIAYNEIKNRKGKTVNGTFIKE